MNPLQFRALLDALMVSDPWPSPCFGVLEEYADLYSELLGYSGWIQAYHEFKAD